jgi:hypothetical protein
VLAGYDVTGTTFDPEDEEALREHLAEQNERVPGTVGVHLTFVEAPIFVAFGKTYSAIRCTVYDSNLQVVLDGELEPPESKTLFDFLLPARYPEVNGRRWGRAAWDRTLSFVFSPRG